MSDYLTISETAKLLNKSTKTLRRWDEEGKLTAVREPMSNYRVYRRNDVETLFAEFLQTDIKETVSIISSCINSENNACTSSLR